MKINFHEMKNFSSLERFGTHDQTAIKRIPELKISIEKLLRKIEEGKLNDKKLKITSEINISLLDDQ